MNCTGCHVDFDAEHDERECPVCAGSAQVARPNGLHLDMSETEYHNDPRETPSLSSTIARKLVRESPAHAYLAHPRLGGQKFVPSTDMDRGTLLHKLLLGAGRELVIIECEAWTKKADKELRDIHREAGKLVVHRKLYDQAIVIARELKPRLAAKGVRLEGHSEVTLLWDETADNGKSVPCRARLDHIDGADIWDLKITGDANPDTLTHGHITSMGYEIQTECYRSGASAVLPHLRGRLNYTLVFCEFEPPYSVTLVRSSGSMRELGARRWRRAVNTWERCCRLNEWDDYTGRSEIVFVEAKPWELDAEPGAA